MPFFRAMKNTKPIECRFPRSGKRQLSDLPRTRCRETRSTQHDSEWMITRRKKEDHGQNQTSERLT